MQHIPSMVQTNTGKPAGRPRRRDRRWIVAGAVSLVIVGLGAVIDFLPSRGVDMRRPAESGERADNGFAGLQAVPGKPANVEEKTDALSRQAADPHTALADRLFAEAEKALGAKNYDAALHQLNQAQAWAQRYPKAYYLIARALEGKGDHETARDFYRATIDRDPAYADAYWGFATTSESLGDLHSALGGMRSFLHTVPDADPQRLRVAQARSAIWEWEAQLGRGPWGPTKGIPPGLKPEDARRDGRGVATMMPVVGTEKPDGSSQFEIKHSEKIKMFKD